MATLLYFYQIICVFLFCDIHTVEHGQLWTQRSAQCLHLFDSICTRGEDGVPVWVLGFLYFVQVRLNFCKPYQLELCMY